MRSSRASPVSRGEPSYSGRRASETGFPIAVFRPQRTTGSGVGRDAITQDNVNLLEIGKAMRVGLETSIWR